MYNIIYFLRGDGREQVEVYGDKHKQTFEIGLLDDHYFLDLRQI